MAAAPRWRPGRRQVCPLPPRRQDEARALGGFCSALGCLPSSWGRPHVSCTTLSEASRTGEVRTQTAAGGCGGGCGEGNGVGDLAAGRPGAGRVVSAEHGMDGELHSCARGSRTVALTSVTPVHSVEVKKLQTEESGVSNATLPPWKDRAERTRVFGGVHRRPGHPPVFTQHTLHGRTG